MSDTTTTEAPYIVTELPCGEVTECATRADLFEHLQFLVEEGSTWTVTRDGKPLTFTIVEV